MEEKIIIPLKGAKEYCDELFKICDRCHKRKGEHRAGAYNCPDYLDEAGNYIYLDTVFKRKNLNCTMCNNVNDFEVSSHKKTNIIAVMCMECGFIWLQNKKGN